LFVSTAALIVCSPVARASICFCWLAKSLLASGAENCISKPYATFFEGDYCFKPDHSFEVLSHEESGHIAKGSWYAAGRFIYFRLPYLWFEDDIPDGITIREVFVWRIQDIGLNELRVQLWTDKPPRVYRRVGAFLPNASNKSLEPVLNRMRKQKPVRQSVEDIVSQKRGEFNSDCGRGASLTVFFDLMGAVAGTVRA